ncbi:hypothetical protein [Pseudarthrobacter sp. NamE5]|uniref:hypothetical protein n=1 Tax=Pseudarthrobacter sp. NamE5 TaxID=2576839 RepID=UPI00110A7E7E|nr:hypothetical protein [Pseudarthrobacter sp. NamE5]TLM87220.1 hypothetical protein FDW84_05345 [Pseudarthrobacter sp. NamE5]
MLLAEPAKWLSQGDIFLEVPVPDIHTSSRSGPALLVTYNCALDKRTGSGKSKVTHLNFLPVRDVTALQPPDLARNLRSRPTSLTPYTALYLGDVPQVGEGYVNLMECFTLPISEFAVQIEDFSEELSTGDPDEDCFRLVDSSSRTRISTLSSSHHALFLEKWRAHWTGTFQGGNE